MIQDSLKNTDKSRPKRDPQHLFALGYDAAEIEVILNVAKYLDAFTLTFDNGNTEHFDFREPRLKVVYGGKV